MYRRAGLLLILATVALGAQADELYLKAGDKLVGTLNRVDEEAVHFETSYAGEITVPRAEVEGIVTAEPVTLVFPDSQYMTGRIKDKAGPAMAIEMDKAVTMTGEFNLAEVQAIYREDPQEVERQKHAVKFTGRVNVGVNVTGGNTETSAMHFDGRLRARTPKNRYTVSLEHNREESADVEVRDDTTGLLKYDHFLSEKWYWFNSATFERDDFQDLNLRSALAGGLGYQFFEEEGRFLSLEGGLSYINEDFESIEDERSVGGRWALDYEQDLLSWLRVFHFHEGLQDFEDSEDLLVRTQTGLRFLLNQHLRATAQANIDWNNAPAPGREELDEQYMLNLGYEF